MYHIIESKHHKLVGMITYYKSNWGLEFVKGKVVDQSSLDSGVNVELESDHDEIPDYFEIDTTPIVSDRFAEIIQAYPDDNYQLIPVSIVMPTNTVVGYYILNVIGNVACVDLGSSDVNLYKSKITRLKKLVLDQSSLSDQVMFRMKEYPLVIVVSGSLREEIESKSMRGILIKPADGWGDLHRF